MVVQLELFDVLYLQPKTSSPFILSMALKYFHREITNSTRKVSIVGPKYDGKYLQYLIKEKLGRTWLHQTLTSVVIALDAHPLGVPLLPNT
ncbi:unnamed protein product, partial [Vitis vinifera]|uniref:Uncharacterized protein n=1 Tax=Vitis vinifera TaxID=29760 RepID=E0CP93_VITVI